MQLIDNKINGAGTLLRSYSRLRNIFPHFMEPEVSWLGSQDGDQPPVNSITSRPLTSSSTLQKFKGLLQFSVNTNYFW